MKTVTRKKIENLINAALNKFSHEELAEVFIDSVKNWRDREAVVELLLLDDDFKQDLKFELMTELTADKMVLNIKSIADREKIENFICTEVCPYYNDQQGLFVS